MKIKILFIFSMVMNICYGQELINYVNPFIGTGAVDKNSLSGNNFPGATMPFGFVQLSPDNKDVPFLPCSGYDYNVNTIVGFSHTHLSGTGIPDLFDVLMMPATGDINPESLKLKSDISGFKSLYSHKEEQARPGYYEVKLLDYNINVELTTTEHVGFHRYTFQKNENSEILIDLNHSLDKKREWYPCKIVAHVKIINATTIEGYRIITGWTQGFRKVYFRAEFSKPFINTQMITDGNIANNQNISNGESVKTLLKFKTDADEKILVKVGLSATSLDNAKLNLSTEVPNWDFDEKVKQNQTAWEKELSSIKIEGTKEQKEIFYTGLYHAFIQPNNIADVNGDYPATDMTVQNAKDKKHYSTFSLWDTYRAANPLYTLVQSERTGSFINSMLRQYKTYGILPMWQLWGLENYCMIGNHAIPVIADAVLKGIKGFDVKEAYEAVKGTSMTNHQSSPFNLLDKYGYFPQDLQSGSVSIGLEIAYDDWCVAQLAKKLGKIEDYNYFINRSFNYKNIFNKKDGFFRAKNKDGNWYEPFNPTEYDGIAGQPYVEGNAWQYLFYVPQDVYGLIDIIGGKNNFLNQLDTFFNLENVSSTKNENVSGFIGQYAHGNEPSQQIAYLYNYASQPWKTQKYVSKILNELYNNSSSGYAGNEDCGQMASWYIFSAMGFYPVNPSNGIYIIGSPVLKSAEIHLDNGKTFTIKTQNASKINCYIERVKLNEKPYFKTYITQNDIKSGGTLLFIMTNKPNKNWGVNSEDLPTN